MVGSARQRFCPRGERAGAPWPTLRRAMCGIETRPSHIPSAVDIEEQTGPMDHATVRLNVTSYRLPARPVVVVCSDGGDPACVEAALRAGVIPNTARFMQSGFSALAQCVIPSL